MFAELLLRLDQSGLHFFHLLRVKLQLFAHIFSNIMHLIVVLALAIDLNIAGMRYLIAQALYQLFEIEKFLIDEVDVFDVFHRIGLVLVHALGEGHQIGFQISSSLIVHYNLLIIRNIGPILLQSFYTAAQLLNLFLQTQQILDHSILFQLRSLQFLQRIDNGGKVLTKKMLVHLPGDADIQTIINRNLSKFLHQLYCNSSIIKLINFQLARYQTHFLQYQPMLSGQNYREFIEQQGQIEKNIAQGWGYQIDQKQYIPKRQKINCNIKVANIQPLRQIYDVPVSKKLEQVEEELLMLQNQRKLNELTQKAIESTQRGDAMDLQEAAAVKMMRQCIQQYNFIIDHRHIAEKNSEKARKILGIQKSESKELFEQIHLLKGQMGKTTLANTIKINSEIAKLYKKYSSIVPRSVNCSDRTTTQNNKSTENRAITSVNASSYMGTSKFSPNKRTGQKTTTQKQSQFKESQTKKDSRIQLKDLVIMPELNESQEGQSMQQSQAQEELNYQPQSLLIHHAITKMQRRVSEYAAPRRRFVTVADIKKREKQEKKERMVTTMEEAYEKKQVINKGKKFDKIIQEHHEVIDVWRHRITQNQEKNKSFHLRFQGKERAKKFKSVNNTRRTGEFQLKTDEQLTSKGVKIHYKAEEIQQNLAEKQRILSLLLSKKQNKFKRIPGTQILQKNDVNSTAKLFLGISKHQHLSHHPTQKPCINNKTLLDLPQWQNLQAEDEKLYWSRCKNQKLNLLLKSRKIQ